MRGSTGAQAQIQFSNQNPSSPFISLQGYTVDSEHILLAAYKCPVALRVPGLSTAQVKRFPRATVRRYIIDRRLLCIFAVQLESLARISRPTFSPATNVLRLWRCPIDRHQGFLTPLAKRHLTACIVQSMIAGLSCISRFGYPKVSRSRITYAANLVPYDKDSHSS